MSIIDCGHCMITYVTAVCVFVAFPIYVIFLFMLHKFRNIPMFSIPFYRLVFVCGIFDLWYTVHYYFILRPPNWGIGTKVFLWFGDTFANVSMYTMWYIRCAQALAVLCISFNRLTSLISPLRHDQIWSSKATSRLIGIQLIAPVLLLFYPFFYGCSYTFTKSNNSTDDIYHHGSSDNKTNRLQCVILHASVGMFLTVVITCLVTLYVCMFVHWHYYKKRNATDAPEAGGQDLELLFRRQISKNLSIGGSVIAGSFALVTAYYWAMAFLPQFIKSSEYFWVMNGVFEGFFCMINPFIFIYLGTKVRPYFWYTFKKVTCRKTTAHELNVLLGVSEPPQKVARNKNQKRHDEPLEIEDIL